MIIADKEFLGPVALSPNELPSTRAVYIIFRGSEVLYVGIVPNLRARLKQQGASFYSIAEGGEPTIAYWEFAEDQLANAHETELHLQTTLRPKFKKARNAAVQKNVRNDPARPASSLAWYFFISLGRLIRQPQFYLLLGAISGLFAIFALFSEPFASYLYQITGRERPYVSALSFGSLLVSLISFSFVYLQSGKSAAGVFDNGEVIRLRLQNIKLTDDLCEATKSLSERVSEIEERESLEFLTQDEKDNVVIGIAEKAGKEAIREIFVAELTNFRDGVTRKLEVDQLRESSVGIFGRLSREISDLRLRANINLLIGMAITAGGLYLLYTTVSIVDASQLLKQLANEDATSDSRFLKNLLLPLIPRVMLVIFIEIFAYFFLQLYKSGLAEIKYFQNELTNLESRVLSVEFAFITGCHDQLKTAFENLAITERNFILNKGQTTVALARARGEQESNQHLIKMFSELMKGKARG